jgi:hypothetical protein
MALRVCVPRSANSIPNGNEVHHRSRHEHVTAVGLRRDARSDMDRNPSDSVLDQFDLAGMDPRANLEP